MPNPGFRLVVSPVKSKAAVPSTQYVTVYNQGSTPLQITMSAREIIRNSAGHCAVANSALSWASVSPANFTLRPGAHETTTLHIRAGAAPGRHDLAAFATAPAGVASQGGATVHTNVSLGSQFLVAVPGHVTSTQRPCLSLAVPKSPGGTLPLPALGVALGIAVLLAVVAGAGVLLRYRHHPH